MRAGAQIENLAQELQREVTRLGNRRLLCIYHVTAANYHASASRLDLAQTHASLAHAHLRAEPNCWLEASLALAQSGIAYLESDLRTALERATYASERAELSGHLWSRAAAATSCAFLLVRAGRSATAAEWIKRAQTLAETIPIIRIGNLENAAQLALLKGDGDTAERVIAELEAKETLRVLENSWYALGISHTRIRLHRILERWTTAETVARQGLELAQQRSDFDAAAMFAACRAEALAMLGRDDEAISEISRALGWMSHATVATVSEVDRVMAVVLARFGQRSLASECLRRATRLAQVIEDAVLISEMDRTATMVSRAEPPVGSDVAHQWVLRLWHLASSIKQPHVLRELLSDELFSNIVRACEPATRLDAARELATRDVPPAHAAPEVVTLDGHSLHLAPHAGREARLSASLLKASVEIMAAKQRAIQPHVAPIPASGVVSEKGSMILIAPSMLQLLDTANRIAATPITVLITGETGSGKEVLARFIHDASDRKGKRFMAVNCSALPRDLVESQMFGHRRGAFTGASESFEGIVKGAEGGTLFLDEIGDLPLDLQPKFLRFLETGEVLPLGSNQPIRVSVRVIAATNSNLHDLVMQGKFRSDLYYRLNGIHFAIPPLRDRREEIPALARHLLDRYAEEFGRGSLSLAEETMEYLLVYDWPGNVRQLASQLRRVAALSETNACIGPELLSSEITAVPAAEPPASADRTITVSADQRLASAIQAIERALITRALERSDGRLDDAARMLGISRKGLFLKRRRYRIGAGKRSEA